MSGPSVGIITLGVSGNLPTKVVTLRPNQNGLPDCDADEWLTSTGDAYECVDEIIKDDDSSYIETYELVSEVSVWFSKPILSIPVGSVIDFVRLGAYWKYNCNWQQLQKNYVMESQHPSWGWQPDLSGVFCTDNGGGQINLVWTLNNCGTAHSSPTIYCNQGMWGKWHYNYMGYVPSDNYYEFDNKYLYSYLLYEINPETGLAWTVPDVDSIQFGVKGISPDFISYKSIYANWYCNDDDENANWDKHGGPYGTFYEYISSNDGTDYLYTDDSGATLTFMFSYPTDFATWENWKDSDLIHVHFDIYIGADFNSGNQIEWIWVKDGVVTVLGTDNVTAVFPNKKHIYQSGVLITNWSDLDPAHNSFGIRAKTIHAGGKIYVDQYRMDEIRVRSRIGSLRVTQEFIDVGYHESSPTPCRLPKPIDIQVNCDYETMGLNFWSGNREVYSLGRSSKRTSLSGIMWDGCTNGVDTCEDIIGCIRSLAKLKEPIEIDGLRYNELDCVYNILSFSWNQVSECPNTYDWNLELEFAHSGCTG